MAWERAQTGSCPGYRYPTFPPNDFDGAIGADEYANMNTALQLMLMQSGEDCPKCSIILLPSWPCFLNVSFKLWAPLNTSIEVEYLGVGLTSGTVVLLDVQPPERRNDIIWANCVT